MLSELGQQSVQTFADLDAERKFYWAQAARAARWIYDQPRTVRSRYRVLCVRCEDGGCLLAEVFRLPLDDGGERYLASPRTRRGDNPRHGFLNWAFSDDWRGMPMYLPAGCRHGVHRLGTGWLMEAVGLIRGWHHRFETVEHMRAQYPVHMQKALRSAVFHPGMQTAWRDGWRENGVQ
jgi:hypothetical protein